MNFIKIDFTGVSNMKVFVGILLLCAVAHAMDGEDPVTGNMARMEASNDEECKEAVSAKFSRDCRDTYPRRLHACSNGIAKIYPLGYNCEKNITQGFEVFCDQETNAGGWTVIQRRKVRNKPPPKVGKVQVEDWQKFVHGFGNISQDFWLGLEKIRQLTYFGEHVLRIDFTYSGKFVKTFAQYRSFKIGSAAENYTLSVSGYFGTAGDYLNPLNGLSFSTYSGIKRHLFSCSALNWGGWWYQKDYIGCRLPMKDDKRWLGNVKIRTIEMKVKRKPKQKNVQ